MPPGSLVHIGDILPERVKISITEYNETNFYEKEDADVSECIKSIENPMMTWVQVRGVNDPAIIAKLGAHFKLHSLILEDILNTNQRSKLDVFNNQLFIVSRMLFMEGKSDLKDEQVSIVLGPNFLISFLENDDAIFKPVKDRIRIENSRIRKSGSDYLAYALLDTIVDNYFNVLEIFDNQLETLEDRVMSSTDSELLRQIQHVKMDVIHLRKAVWPMREVINRFQYLETPLVLPATQLYLRDVHDHTVQTIDIIEGFRDVISGLQDLYMSNINLRLNEIVKVLTIVSTIFVPLSFVTGIYGMTFDHMPMIHSRLGFPMVMFIMGIMAICMIYFFRRRKWI